jgi:large subunit ribosomal protein L6
MHGTSQRLISNMIQGVTAGFKKELEIHGVGFRAAVKGTNLDLSLGYSHPLLHPIPKELKVAVVENTRITVEGIDKQLVGQFAADVRNYYPPEPYKGKGVRYTGEHIRRKEGKSVK